MARRSEDDAFARINRPLLREVGSSIQYRCLGGW